MKELIYIAIVVCLLAFVEANEIKDKLKLFYERVVQSDAKYCPDKTRLLPDCKQCIPGLKVGAGSTSCNEYIPSSKAIRDEIGQLTKERFGHAPVLDRPFGLYPYLEKPDFLRRQITFGKLLSTKKINTLMDIGAYYNPINLFLTVETCPTNMIVVEPILDALSVMIPCSSGGSTHFIFLPITFKYYMDIRQSLPMPESIVCIGCDGHYGPSRKMLETAFTRPYSLYIEYPSEYVHNKPFKGMIGEGPGEEMTFMDKYQPKTNETQYTKRVMKVIEYKPV